MQSARMPAPSPLEDTVSAFTTLRPHLLLIAYRILKSSAAAEDVVQETWMRWQNTDRTRVHHPPAYLARITAHLALDVTQSARFRYETGVNPRPAEATDAGADPVARAERAEAVELALRLLLERLSPTERAAYILRVAFDYPYHEIAASLRLSEVNSRQIVSRARKRLLTERHVTVSTVEHQRLLRAFVAAAQSGRLTGLEDLLGADTGRERIRVVKRSDVVRQPVRCEASLPGVGSGAGTAIRTLE